MSPSLSLRLGFLTSKTGLIKLILPFGGRKQTTVMYEKALCRLKGARRESVLYVTVHDIGMSFHWPRKGTSNTMVAGEEQRVKEMALDTAEGTGFSSISTLSLGLNWLSSVWNAPQTKEFQQALSPYLLYDIRGSR